MTSAAETLVLEAGLDGETLALDGLALAFRANTAFDLWRTARAERTAELDEACETLEPTEYVRLSTETLEPVLRLARTFANLSGAAGDLIGYETEGGEHLPTPVHEESQPAP